MLEGGETLDKMPLRLLDLNLVRPNLHGSVTRITKRRYAKGVNVSHLLHEDIPGALGAKYLFVPEHIEAMPSASSRPVLEIGASAGREINSPSLNIMVIRNG